MERSGHVYQGFNIRREIPINDFPDWQCYVPDQHTLPKQLKRCHLRCLVISGPSVSYWFRDNERYHKNLSCNSTKKAHSVSLAAIRTSKNQERTTSWWILVFPQGNSLDNCPLSLTEHTVTSHMVPLVSKDAVGKGKHSYGCAVQWEMSFNRGRSTLSFKATG